MGNRRQLDPGVEQQVRDYLADVLTNQGSVNSKQLELTASMIDRSPRTVSRYVAEVADSLGIDLRAGATPVGQVGGLDALLNRQRFTFADDEMKRLALAYAGNLAQLHRDARRLADARGLDGPVSYEQLTRKFRVELSSNERALIRKGIRGFKDASLYVRWSASYRNEVWQIDATKMDFWMLPSGSNERIRPSALFIVDDYSRVILAATLMLHEYTAEDSAACVHRAMRIREVTLPDGQIIELGGAPEKILCDNALQFTGQVLSHVAMTLGFTMWAVAAYAGEKKGKVERAIRAANEDFARRLPGYANRNLKTLSLKDQLHATDLQLLDEQQALDELGKWVEEWNNSPHPDQPGKSRYEVWADDDHAIEVVDEELLRPATVALPRPNYIYHKDGFRIQQRGIKRYYIDTSLKLDVRNRYLLRHLPDVTEWVDAYTLEGEFVTRCFDSALLDEQVKQEIEQHRRMTYRELSSLRSEAVELRALAATEARDTGERPSPIATAHQQTLPATSDLVAASLGIDDSRQLPAGDDRPDDEIHIEAEEGVDGLDDVPKAVDYDALAEQAVADLTDGRESA